MRILIEQIRKKRNEKSNDIYIPLFLFLFLFRWYRKSFNLELQTTHDMSGRITHPEESARKIEWIVDHLVRMQNILFRTFYPQHSLSHYTHSLTHTLSRTILSPIHSLSPPSGPFLLGVLTVHDHGVQVPSPRYRISEQVNIAAVTIKRQAYHFLKRHLTEVDSVTLF